MGSPIVHQRICWLRFCAATRWHLRCPAGHPLSVHERRPERHARSVWSMVLAWRIAVPVHFEHSVRKPPRRTNHGKSAPFFGPLHPFRLNPLLTLLPLLASMKGRLFSPLLPLFCGETGHVVCFVVAG